MISLKRTKAEAKLRDSLAEPVPNTDLPEYPWGLQLDLNQDTLPKLNMDVTDYKPGDVLFFRIRTEVRSLISNDTFGGKSQTMSLQITDMGLDSDD